jgi:hypothetical protein
MDAAVANSLNRGNGLYAVDEDLLVELQPTHIITQDLCNVTPFLLPPSPCPIPSLSISPNVFMTLQ